MDDVTGWMLMAAAWMWLFQGVQAAWKARPRQTDQEPRPATFLLGIGSAVVSALFLGGVVATYFGIPAPRWLIQAFWGLGAVGLLAALPARRETMRARWLKDPAGVESWLRKTRWFGRAALIAAAAFAFCLVIRSVIGWEPIWVFALFAFIPMVGFGHAWLVRLWDANCIRSWQNVQGASPIRP